MLKLTQPQMAKLKWLLVILGVIVIAGIAVYVVSLLNQPNTQAIVTTPSTEPMISATATPNPNLTISAWIPDWDSKAGLTSLQNTAVSFYSISPVWYSVKADGSLTNLRPRTVNELTEQIALKNALLIPAVSMQDHEIFTPILASPETIQKHAEAILAEVDKYNYAGIDLDYESTKLSDKTAYFDFLRFLSNKLHRGQKKLIVTVLAKWGDDVVYPSLKETRQVQDWTEISRYADQIRIMAYDYTFSKADQAGPIAPLSWIKKVLDYAVQKIPRQKIVLGIHMYSYEWWQELAKAGDPPSILQFIEDPNENTAVNNKAARSYTYSVVKTVLQNYKGNLTTFDGEEIYRYTATNKQTNKKENRILVFIDPNGVQARTDLAKGYGIQGVCFWRLGGEGDLL